MAIEEKIASQIVVNGILLLIASLLSGIISIGIYVWVSSRKEYANQVIKDDKRFDKMEDSQKDHEKRLNILETEHEHNHCEDYFKRKKK